MISKSKQEYDAFGPWVYEIKGEHTMPPLFVKHYKEEEQPLMLIKIPRRIDRRDATPGMNLYDYVIGAFETRLHIFKRVRDGVEEKEVSYGNVVAIKNTISMLKGLLLLYMNDETVTIEYNTVSEPIMMRLIDIIRDKYNTREKVLEIEPLSHEIDVVGHLYSAKIDRYIASDNKIRLVAYQPASKYVPYFNNLKEMIKALPIISKVITNTAFLTNDTELIVLQRDNRIRRKKQGDITYSSLYLPYSSIKKVIKTDKIKRNKLYMLNISVSNQTFSFLYGDNSLQVDALYSALKE